MRYLKNIPILEIAVTERGIQSPSNVIGHTSAWHQPKHTVCRKIPILQVTTGNAPSPQGAIKVSIVPAAQPSLPEEVAAVMILNPLDLVLIVPHNSPETSVP